MDNLDESKGFFKHVFHFDDDAKSDVLNILQYTFVAVIPMVVLNKTMQKYVPEPDDKKSSIEITAELAIQLVVMFLGMLMIHRIITYIPTYSKTNYPDFHVTTIILAVLMITTSLQTKLGEKVSILSDRVMELWNGKTEEKSKTGKKGTVKVSQPISGQGQGQSGYGQSGYGQGTITIQPSDGTGTAISSLPTFETSSQPNYDAMYTQQTTPLIHAASPSMEGFMEPMAANAVLGSGGFGSW